MVKLDKRKALADMKARSVLGQDKAQEDYLGSTFDAGKKAGARGCLKAIYLLVGAVFAIWALSLLLWYC